MNLIPVSTLSMKSKSLVIRGFVSIFFTCLALSDLHAQQPTFYTSCPTIKESGTRICIPILVDNITNLDAMQIKFKINPNVFTLEELIVPSKNPLEIASCTDLNSCEFSYVDNFLSYVYYKSAGVDLQKGDTLITLCGTLGDVGEQFSLIPDMDFASIGVRDLDNPGNTLYIPGDDMVFDFCRFTVDPQNNALTIVSGYCEETLGNVNNGKIFLNFVGGTAPYSYTITGDGGYSSSGSNINGEFEINNLSQQLYTIVVTDALGATKSKNIAITKMEPFELDTHIYHPKCARANQSTSSLGSIAVFASGGNAVNEDSYSYAWSNNEISDSIYGLIEGIYTVTVTDQNRCRVVDTVTLVAPPELVFNSIEGVLPCENSTNGIVEIEVSGGTPFTSPLGPYEYYRDGLRREMTSQVATITRVSANSNITVYDGNRCRLNVPLIDNNGRSTLKLDSVFSLRDSFFYTCFEDLTLIEINQRVNSVYGVYVPRITAHFKENDPSYVMGRDNTGGNLIRQSLNEGRYIFEVKDQSGQCVDTFSIDVIKPSAFTATPASIQPNCADTTGFISIATSGGTMPYSYKWSHDTTKLDSVLLQAGAGSYTILATDANGCNPQNIQLTLNPSQILKIDSILVVDTIQCGGDGSLQVYSDYPGVNFMWNPGGITTASLVTKSSGNYTAIATSPDGLCSDTLSAFLPEKVAYTVYPGLVFNPICGSNDGSNAGFIEIDTIVGGNPGFTYLWTVSGTNNIVSDSSKAVNLGPGSYDLVISDASNCMYSQTFNLTAPAPVDIHFDTSSLKGVTCNVGAPDGKATVSVSGGAGSGYRYIWNNGERTPGAVALPFGPGSVYIIDANSCYSDTITFDIPESPKPEIFESVSLPSCETATDGSITLDIIKNDPSDIIQVIWITADGTSRSGLSAGNLGVGRQSYFVNINGNIACPIADSVVINDFGRFSIAIDPLTTSDNTCRTTGESQIGLQIAEGTGPARYVLNGDTVAGSIIMGLTAGTYQIIGVSDAGCLDTVSHELKFNEQVKADIQPFDAPLCIGQKVCIQPSNVTGGNGRSYTFGIDFDKPIDIGSCVELLPGSYRMQVYDSDGCKYDTAFVIASPEKFEIDLGEDIEYGLGDDMPAINVNVVSGGSISQVEWKDAQNIQCDDASCISVRVSQIANFTLEAIAMSADGCMASDQVNVRVNDKENVFIPNIFRPGSPTNFDPTNDTWQIAVGKGVEKVTAVRIFDRWGNKVFESLTESSTGDDIIWDGIYRGSPLNPGVYVYEVDVVFLKRADEIDAKKKSFTGSITLIR